MTAPDTAIAARVAGRRSVAAGALARLASMAPLVILSWPDELWAVGIQTFNLPVLAVSGLLLATAAPVALYGRDNRPGSRLAVLVVSALSAWAVPPVLVVNLALLHFVVTEPDELCHTVPCGKGLAWTALWTVAALAAIADALLSTTGAVRMCRRLPAGALRRTGWIVLACGALLVAASVIDRASRW